MTAPETPTPHEPKETLDFIFSKMDTLKNEFFDSIKVITDDYESKRLINSLTYGSYHANRGYGMSAETYAKMMGWDSYTAQAYEAAYQANMEQQRNDERYKRLMRDLELLEDGNDFLNQ